MAARAGLNLLKTDPRARIAFLVAATLGAFGGELGILGFVADAGTLLSIAGAAGGVAGVTVGAVAAAAVANYRSPYPDSSDTVVNGFDLLRSAFLDQNPLRTAQLTTERTTEVNAEEDLRADLAMAAAIALAREARDHRVDPARLDAAAQELLDEAEAEQVTGVDDELTVAIALAEEAGVGPTGEPADDRSARLEAAVIALFGEANALTTEAARPARARRALLEQKGSEPVDREHAPQRAVRRAFEDVEIDSTERATPREHAARRAAPDSRGTLTLE